jgi:hypothetical protein
LAKPGAVLLLTLAFLGFPALSVEAQDEVPLRFNIVPETGEAAVEVAYLLEDPGLLEAIHSGLPLRIRILTQLWKDGFFDDVKGRYEWRASVMYDPLTRRYRVQTGTEEGVVHEVNTLEEARQTLQLTLDIPIIPSEEGRYYYEADVEMETLSLSDFEELQRWLQGELAPAVARDEDVQGAMARGVRRLLVRMLGLPARRFRVRSPTFEVDPADPPGLSRDPLQEIESPLSARPPATTRDEPGTTVTPHSSIRLSFPNTSGSRPPPGPS